MPPVNGPPGSLGLPWQPPQAATVVTRYLPRARSPAGALLAAALVDTLVATAVACISALIVPALATAANSRLTNTALLTRRNRLDRCIGFILHDESRPHIIIIDCSTMQITRRQEATDYAQTIRDRPRRTVQESPQDRRDRCRF